MKLGQNWIKIQPLHQDKVNTKVLNTRFEKISYTKNKNVKKDQLLSSFKFIEESVNGVFIRIKSLQWTITNVLGQEIYTSNPKSVSGFSRWCV